MKNSHFLLALAAATCLTFTGCKKSEEESPAPATTIKDFFEKTEVKSQTFTINTDNGQSSITGEEGTKVTFPENAFTTIDGTPVTGAVSIELKEIYEKSDMVLSERPTSSDGKLLISGGEIFINATANGQELQLAENTSILVELATTDLEEGMGLFTGSEEDSVFNWTPVPIDSSQVAVNDSNWVNDTIPTYYYDPSHYIFTINTLHWINCDAFYNSTNNANLSITYTGEPSINNTKVYLIFRDINSVLQPSAYNSIFSVGALPVGQDITIVVIGIKDGNEYFASKDITLDTDITVNLDLVQSSESEIKAALEGLN